MRTQCVFATCFNLVFLLQCGKVIYLPNLLESVFGIIRMPVVFGTVEDWDHDYIIVCTVGISVNCIAECKYAFIVAESFLVCHFSREVL